MGKYKDLMVNTGLFAFTQIATKLITFFLVPLYTAYMSTADFGVTDMSSTVVSMVLPLATLSVSDGVLRFAIDDKTNRDRYISLGLVVVLFSIIVVAVLSPCHFSEVWIGIAGCLLPPMRCVLFKLFLTCWLVP